MIDARQLLREGRRPEAFAAAQAAYRAAPNDVDAQLMLGLTSAGVGRAAEAAPLLSVALLALGPAGEARHWRVLAQLRNHLLDAEGEVEALGEAARREPEQAVNWLRLAAALNDLHRPEQALEAAGHALRLEDSPDARRLYVDALGAAAVVDLAQAPQVLRALAETWSSAARIQSIAIRLLRAGAQDLLPAILSSGPVRDVVLEQDLTALRRDLLEGGSAPLELRAALAKQAFINEYAWTVTPPETVALEALGEIATPEALLTYAAYRPLGERADADRWLAADLPEAARDVIRQQISEPRQDRANAAAVPAMTPIHGVVTQAVQVQYEANPYPRWTRAPRLTPMPLDRVLASQFPHAAIAPIPNAATPRVLVAGCGSGQHAIQAATRYAGATVLAVDLSRASLGYAQRKRDELGVDNLTFAQADLLALQGEPFDAIECVGVLHHLDDPAAGFRSLSGLLRPGGVMLLGFYSQLGRRGLEPARRLATSYPATPDGLRALRQAVIGAPERDPLRAALGFGDFYALSSCRDLLMHVQEHQLTTDDLQRLTDGFRVIGVQVAPDILAAYRNAFPDDPAAIDLARWGKFEAGRADTFRGMYQFWIQKPA